MSNLRFARKLLNCQPFQTQSSVSKSRIALGLGLVKEFHVSCPLQHDPTLKKKKKLVIDPKKQRKLEKQEAKRRLEPILIPVDPDSIADPSLVEEKRRRPAVQFSVEELEKRVLLSKEWSRYCLEMHRSELLKLQIKAKSRQDALRQLKKISPFLYDEAIKVDKEVFPLTFNGPFDTPPCKDYIPPDLDDIKKKKKV